MKRLFLFLFFLAAAHAQAQRITQIQKISEGQVACILKDTLKRNHFALTIGTGWDKDPLSVNVSIDSLYRSLSGIKVKNDSAFFRTDSILWEFAGPVSANLFFVNRQEGFVYGTCQFYRCYVLVSVIYVLRTGDGGKTWELSIGKPEQEQIVQNYHTEINPGSFFMFDERKGFLLVSRDAWDGKIRSLVTDDGGKTWKEQTIEAKEKNYFVSSVHFTSSGTCTLVLSVPEKKSQQPFDEGKTLVLMSVDYGQSFRLMK